MYEKLQCTTYQSVSTLVSTLGGGGGGGVTHTYTPQREPG